MEIPAVILRFYPFYHFITNGERILLDLYSSIRTILLVLHYLLCKYNRFRFCTVLRVQYCTVISAQTSDFRRQSLLFWELPGTRYRVLFDSLLGLISPFRFRYIPWKLSSSDTTTNNAWFSRHIEKLLGRPVLFLNESDW